MRSGKLGRDFRSFEVACSALESITSSSCGQTKRLRRSSSAGSFRLFKIDKTPTFTVSVPLVLEGIDEPQSVRATFRAVSDEEALAMDARSAEGFKAWLRSVIVRLHDVEDDEGNPVESSPELIERMLGFQHVRLALQSTYWRAMIKARVGN